MLTTFIILPFENLRLFYTRAHSYSEIGQITFGYQNDVKVFSDNFPDGSGWGESKIVQNLTDTLDSVGRSKWCKTAITTIYTSTALKKLRCKAIPRLYDNLVKKSQLKKNWANFWSGDLDKYRSSHKSGKCFRLGTCFLVNFRDFAKLFVLEMTGLS